MADIYMHTKLAKEVISKIDYKFNESLVANAAQGPDTLYYNFFSKEHTEYRKYADMMHREDTDKLFINMTHFVKNNLTIDTYSFLVGFICHYALDVKIHPYVYNQVGVYKKEDPLTHPWRGLHLKFERSIDAVLIKEETGKSAKGIKLYKNQFPLKYISPEIMNLMEYVLKETYGKSDGGTMYYVSTIEMRKNLIRFVRDISGIKKLFLKFMDKINKKNDLFFQDMSMFNHIEKYDFLNKERRAWYHPVTNEEYHYSVIDLYDQAVKFAGEMIDNIEQYIFENNDIDLTKVFTNLSFNTGLKCDQGNGMKYFNIYRK